MGVHVLKTKNLSKGRVKCSFTPIKIVPKIHAKFLKDLTKSQLKLA